MRTQRFMHRVVRLLLIGLLGLLSISLVACDSGGDNGGSDDEEEEEEGFPAPPGRPGFTSSVTGSAAPLSFSGAALHGVDSTGEFDGVTPSFGFAVRLDAAGGDAPAAIVLVSERAAAPAPGVYAIGDPTADADFAAWMALPGRSARLQATAGTLEIMSRAGDTIVGRFRFEAHDTADGLRTVSGAFRSEARR